MTCVQCAPFLRARPHVLAKMAAEFLGCVMFHFIGSVCPTAVANGLALMTSVYYSAKVSGGHLNPAVTAVFCLLGFTHPLEAVMYVAAQISGCIVGALLVALTTPGAYPGVGGAAALSLGCFVPRAGLALRHVAAWEAVGTVTFVVPVMSVVWYTQNKSGYGNTGPIMVGIALITSAMAVGDWTGAALNPARVLGSAIVFDCARNAVTGAYIGGQMLGAALCPLFIAPWYGISNRAWFGGYLPPRMQRALSAILPSIELRTMDREMGIVYSAPPPSA